MSTGGPSRCSLSRSELARVSHVRAPTLLHPRSGVGCSGPEGSTGAVVEMKTASGLFRPGAGARAWIPYHRAHDDPRMDHVGIVVDDLAAAIEFFVELGLELPG